MMKDYKGEMPKNVTTPDKAKAKKPFYKDWKFWVLTGLMTLFGACSIYGLVLGSQYVKAIERASHIIADAQGSSGDGMKKNRAFAVNDYDSVCVLDLGQVQWTRSSNSHCFFTDIADLPEGLSSMSIAEFVVDGYRNVGYRYPDSIYDTMDMVASIQSYSDRFFIIDKYALVTQNMTASQFQTYVSGKRLYFKADSSYTGETAYETIYEEGYNQGHFDGYQEGYSDGSDAINVNQYFRVVMPVGDYAVQYESFINGVSDDQGQIVGGSTTPNYREFTRNRNQVLRVDLTLPENYRAFWLYTPSFTSGYPVDDNVSLQQSWAVDGVVYLPTWVGSVQLYVGVTSASVPDLTTQTISVAFDVSHWGDIKVGAYQQGYQQGYVDGQEDPTAYQSGYDAGKEDGYAEGETAGFNRGVAVGSSGSQSLAMMFKTAFQLPFDQLYRFLNFNLLGINFLSLFTALISVSIGIMVIKKVL